MASRMMRWRPWPPLLSRKFRVKLVVRRVEGVGGGDEAEAEAAEERKMALEVRWKGRKLPLRSLRRTVKKNRTKEEEVVGDGGLVVWKEEFQTVCTLTAHRENDFYPWEVVFTAFGGSNQGTKTKQSVLGVASLNISELTFAEEIELHIPLLLPGAAESTLSLHLALRILELKSPQDSSDTVQNSPSRTSSPRSGDVNVIPPEKEELSALKAGLRKVKILTEIVYARRSKKACPDVNGSEGKCSARSDNIEYGNPFDTDSLDDLDEVEDIKQDTNARNSFSYGTLASVNNAGYEMKTCRENEDHVYYNHRRSDIGCSHAEDKLLSIPDFSMSKRSFLPWKKRKLSFRSPKSKGEPLLKKAYEEGGDDIDYDRRLLSSSDESLSASRRNGDDGQAMNRESVSDFGDDCFVIGSWESKDLVSRDGHMKLTTDVFFASIDQRSERASGESACTALVAVIAEWFHKNQNMMLIRSQFDNLIREGSLEWRNLCENRIYQDCFPDKLFDLDTVLQAKIRPLSVAPKKSFIGFFHPEGGADNNSSDFNFLSEAMSIDSIWDEISRTGSNSSSNAEPQLYIVSWNDHFFILKVAHDSYYIIETLGERLYEGCRQAYIIKFDNRTRINLVSNATEDATESENEDREKRNTAVEGELVCRGKESCKEYLESFLADIKKGRTSSTPLHQCLQIEFHFTESAPLSTTPESLLQPPWPVKPAGAFASVPLLVAYHQLGLFC